MTPATTKLLAEVLKLDPAEREALAEEALRSLSHSDQASIDAAWLADAHRRDAEYESGNLTAAPISDVLARLTAKAKS